MATLIEDNVQAVDDPYGKIDSPNQAPPLENHDLFHSGEPLVEALKREGGEWAVEEVVQFGRVLTAEPLKWARQANENPPQLRTFDRFGNRIDEVEFHPAWHQMLAIQKEHGICSISWENQHSGAHVVRAAKFMLQNQVESGTCCITGMTHAGIPVLMGNDGVDPIWIEKLKSREYEAELKPIAEKAGATLGVAMTEKQGGSDVRTNLTVAESISGADNDYLLTGHKWFCSAPMSDGFLVLAQTKSGISCFLAPRILPDGTRNRFFLQRLKDKLGNRSNASSELELDRTWGQLVGEEGRGVATIIEMVNHTRLDCVLASAGWMRETVTQATHHANHRSAFGKLLVDQPLMMNVLADLGVEAEAATISAIRLARSCDLAAGDSGEADFRRISNAVLKYWICKRAIDFVAEAMECLGGNGYVEESGLPRIFREAPLNSIWEGCGNVNCLDAVRAMVKTPETVDAFLVEVELASGENAHLDTYIAKLKGDLADLTNFEARARRTVETMALALQGSLMVRFGNQTAADAFCASRLGGDHGGAYGTLNPTIDFGDIISRHEPRI